MKVSIDKLACTKCGTCVSACSAGIFRRAEKEAFPEIVSTDSCISCGDCVAACLAGAIRHSIFPGDRIHDIDPSKLPSREQASLMFRAGRPIRAFRPAAVEKDLVDAIIEASRCAPAGQDARGAEYVVVQDPATLDGLRKATAEYYPKMIMVLNNQAVIDSLPAPRREALVQMKPALPLFENTVRAFKAGEDPALRGAPNLLVIHTEKRLSGRIDCTLAAGNAMLMCHSLGLGSFYAGCVQAIVDFEPKIPKLLGIPDGHDINGIVAFGYPEYRFMRWADLPPAKVTWISPGNNEALAQLEAEERRTNVEYWDRFAKGYDTDIDFAYGQAMRPLGRERLNAEGRFEKTVEFACGTGFYTGALSEMSGSVLATDLSETFLGIARERLGGLKNVSFGTADCERTGMPDSTYDLVFAGLLGNSIDLAKTYAEFYRILKPGGTYIAYIAMFEIMDAEPKRMLRQRQVSSGKTGAPPKYYEHTPDEYRQAAVGAGFTVAAREIVRDPDCAASVPFLYMKCVKD